MTLYLGTRQRVIACVEGTPGTIATAAGMLGPCSGVKSSYIGSATPEDAYLGYGITNFSVTPQTGRYGTVSWNELLRSDGVATMMLFGALGSGSDAISGAGDPYTHTGTITSSGPKTYTIYHDTGAATGSPEFIAYPYGTLSSWSLSWSPTQSPTVAAQAMGTAPTLQASAPTITTRTKANRVRNKDAVYTIQDSSGAGTTYPTADVVSGTISFTRPTQPVTTAGQDAATDIGYGGLVMNGSLELVYRGSAALTAFNDWQVWKEQGVSAHKNKIVWTPADGHSIEIDWWPMVFTSADVTAAADALHVMVNFTASNDLATSNVASPTGTAPSAVVVLSPVSTVYA